MGDFGAMLREARERRGISLGQMAASTKISPAALEALERNDIRRLPGGIFSRGYVRSYAAVVGLDPEETVGQFLQSLHGETAAAAPVAATTVPPEEIEFERQREAARRIVRIAAAILPIVALVGFLAFRGGDRTPAAQSSAAPEAVGTAGQETGLVPVPAMERQTVPAPTTASSPLTMEIRATGECWVGLTVDGRKIFERLMHDGERASYDITHDAVVHVGNAAAFTFALNGRQARPLGAAGQVRIFRVTPSTAAQFLP